MRPRTTSYGLAVAVSLVCWTTVCGQDRPNIVFVLIDDLRYDTFGFMGHPFIETPHIDRLAEQGARFTNAFVTTSLCSPSRASFLTGRYAHNHQIVDNQSRFAAGVETFPQRLQQAGYRTAFIGKWHMGSSHDQARPGFDHWVSFRGQGTYRPEQQTLNINGQRVPRQKYMTDELTDYAVDWLQRQPAGKPFMLYLSHKGVHGLYDPAPRHRDRYRDAAWQPPATMQRTPQDSGQPIWVRDQRNSWHGVEFPYYGRSGQSLGQMYRHYCEMILSIDDSLGRVTEVLRARGLEHNTLVLFTSDGGHLWGEHGLIDKRCAYEESIRIPLLAYCPGLIAAGTEIDQLVANIDVAPTLLELAGVPISDDIDGRSLLGFFSASSAAKQPRQPLLYEYFWEWSFPQTPTTFAIRDERYKLIQYHGIWDTDELYDLVEDPRETRNLIRAAEHRQRVSRLRTLLHERLEQTGGLAIPLGFKRGSGTNLRHPDGTPRASFPRWMRAEKE